MNEHTTHERWAPLFMLKAGAILFVIPSGPTTVPGI